MYAENMKPIKVGIIGFDRLTALDLVGPVDAFDSAHSPQSPYEVSVIGLSSRPFTAHSGLVFKPRETLQTVGEIDTLVIPGGAGSRDPEISRVLVPWLRAQAPKCRRVATVCTGAYLMAATGLLDGRRVTTHWNHAADLARRFPALKVEPDAIYLKSDKFYTSAGISAGIDLTLALIEEDYGSDVALRCARELVVYFNRPGGQRQFSEPLRLQTGSNDQFSGLMAWMAGNLCTDLSVEALANKVSLSRRHFTRLFHEAYGASPAEVVETLRLDESRTLLANPHATVSGVAAAVGFSNPDSFRRAFTRHFGIAPSNYRI
jgi:transcriptional regulator GlxA family with amidase domain